MKMSKEVKKLIVIRTKLYNELSTIEFRESKKKLLNTFLNIYYFYVLLHMICSIIINRVHT